MRYTDYARKQPLELDDEDLNPDNDEDNHTQYARLEPNQQQSKFDYQKHGLTYTKVKDNEQRVFTDKDIVPYNEYLTLKYGTHICIEYVFGQKACKYLFKYLLKGVILHKKCNFTKIMRFLSKYL